MGSQTSMATRKGKKQSDTQESHGETGPKGTPAKRKKSRDQKKMRTPERENVDVARGGHDQAGVPPSPSTGRRRPATGGAKPSFAIPDGKGNGTPGRNAANQYNTCEPGRKRGGIRRSKNQGNDWPPGSSDDVTSGTHETHKVAHRVLGERQRAFEPTDSSPGI